MAVTMMGAAVHGSSPLSWGLTRFVLPPIVLNRKSYRKSWWSQKLLGQKTLQNSREWACAFDRVLGPPLRSPLIPGSCEHLHLGPGPALYLNRGTVLGRSPYWQAWAVTRETWPESQMLTMETNLMGLGKVKDDTGNHQCQESHFEGGEQWWGTSTRRKSQDIRAKASVQRFRKAELWDREARRSVLVPSLEIPIERDWSTCSGGRPWSCYSCY